MPVSGAAYLDRPSPAIFFIFPDFSIKYKGKYKICFTLFEETKRLEDEDRNAIDPGLFFNAVTPTTSDASRESFQSRFEIKSNQFTVFSAKKFPGLAKSTTLSKALAEQGCRVRIRRDVMMKRMEGKDYDSGDDADGSLNPMQFPSLWLGFQDERFRHTSTGSSKKEKMKFLGGIQDLTVKKLPKLQPIAIYKPGPAPAPPLVRRRRRRRQVENSDPGASSASIPEPVTYCTPPSDTESMTNSDKTIAHDLSHHDGHFLASSSPATVSREEIWSALRRCLRISTDASSFENSANETTITQGKDEPLSHKIKRSCHEWWLGNASDPWENILPDENLIVFADRHLLHLIFSSWHRDCVAGPLDLRESRGWLWFTSAASEQEDRIVEQLVHDISVQLGRATPSTVKKTPSGSSNSSGPSGPASRINCKSCETSKSTGKRDRSERERGHDSLDEDDPNQNDGAKRRKRSADDLNRYVICTQYATGRESARSLTKCFFGAWCSVDRLKQDHLIKVHNFETTQMQIDRGGTESEKWWLLFDKLNPGYRDANPEKFIPGPFYEDRVAHNTYNKIFSEAMKRTERIQQRCAQSLASDIQSLLDRHQYGERQDIRQVVLDVLHSRESNSISSEQLSISERMQSESNNFHNERETMSTSILQQPESSTASNFFNNSILSESNWDMNYATVRPSEYLAPSWSWASIIGPIHYFNIVDSEHTIDVSDLGPVSRPKILEAETDPAGFDPFGRLKAGVIGLEGVLKIGQVRGPKDNINAVVSCCYSEVYKMKRSMKYEGTDIPDEVV